MDFEELDKYINSPGIHTRIYNIETGEIINIGMNRQLKVLQEKASRIIQNCVVNQPEEEDYYELFFDTGNYGGSALEVFAFLEGYEQRKLEE